MNKCRKIIIGLKIKIKKREKEKDNSTKLQKLNIEAEVYKNNKKCDREKKKLKSLIKFHSANKIDNYNRGEKEKEKKRKKIQRNLQNKSKHKNDVFLESLLSESFPSLGVTVHLTSLGCPPTLCWSLDLLWGQFRF